jgi:tellurite resistance protein TehA-like permease
LASMLLTSLTRSLLLRKISPSCNQWMMLYYILYLPLCVVMAIVYSRPMIKSFDSPSWSHTWCVVVITFPLTLPVMKLSQPGLRAVQRWMMSIRRPR